VLDTYRSSATYLIEQDGIAHLSLCLQTGRMEYNIVLERKQCDPQDVDNIRIL